MCSMIQHLDHDQAKYQALFAQPYTNVFLIQSTIRAVDPVTRQLTGQNRDLMVKPAAF